MAIKKRKTKNGCKVSIEGDMTIYEAVETCETLKKILGENKSVDIDLQGVTEIDTAGVQILLSLKKQANVTDKVMTISMHSEPVVEVFELLNIVQDFGDPIVLSS